MCRFTRSCFARFAVVVVFGVGVSPGSLYAETPTTDAQNQLSASLTPAEFAKRQSEIRAKLADSLGIPTERVDLNPESRGEIRVDNIIVEKWILTAEPGSKIPCNLYRPATSKGRSPAIVLCFGHGGSKSQWPYQYAAQMYAKLGIVCLAMDPIGEEERHTSGRRGTREHDHHEIDERANHIGRPVLGKMVFDTTRGIDYLLTRDDIDPYRIGIVGNSLGGTVAQFTAAIETRLRGALVCGWSYDSYNSARGKACSRLPSEKVEAICTWSDVLALSAPDCAVMIFNGDADTIIENRPPLGSDAGGIAWEGNHKAVQQARDLYEAFGGDPDWVQELYQPGGGHREYFTTRPATLWLHRHLGTPFYTLDQVKNLSAINAGQWCDRHAIGMERLYGTELHRRGLTMVDLNIDPIPVDRLAVLNSSEIGIPLFTIAGWLDQNTPATVSKALKDVSP